VRLALFDRRFGVDTEDELSAADMGTGDDPRNVWYQPAGVLQLRRILPPRQVGPGDVLLDIGSGKGRVVLQAALTYRFRRIYGVELSAHLHEIALRNLEICRLRLRCRDVRLVRANVAEYEIPDDVTVVFLYNPVTGGLFQSVVGRLVASLERRPRTMRIVYANPVEEAALLHTGRVRLVRALRGWRPGAQWSRSNSCRLYVMT
jgi:protein-L-isoaspartate O-methyltransferase